MYTRESCTRAVYWLVVAVIVVVVIYQRYSSLRSLTHNGAI